jgi:predicted methyltransferase
MIKTISVVITVLLLSVSIVPASYGADDGIRARLGELINSEDRAQNSRDRNQYRHPLETLMFFGLRPEQTVVEIWPGGQNGWYRSILQPFFENQSGTYIPVMSNSSFPSPVAAVPDGTADMVLVFRAHGFLIYDKPLNTYYEEIFRMLKPGGLFGIVDHRELESRVQDPIAVNGYVKEVYLRALAENAGFEFLEKSEINANSLDTKDYPEGLYSLPPTLRGSTFNGELRDRVMAIGESDRMTMKFRKPL